MSETFSRFHCANCKTEIQASPDMAGQETECPACGARISIPSPDDTAIVRHQLGDDDPESIAAMKHRTIRIELGDI